MQDAKLHGEKLVCQEVVFNVVIERIGDALFTYTPTLDGSPVRPFTLLWIGAVGFGFWLNLLRNPMSSAIDRGDEKRLQVVDAIPVWLAVAMPLPGRVGAARCDHPGPSQAIKRREPQAWRSVGGQRLHAEDGGM